MLNQANLTPSIVLKKRNWDKKEINAFELLKVGAPLKGFQRLMLLAPIYKGVYVHISEALHSDNKAYATYEVSIQDVLELWDFTCYINTQEYSKEELKISSIANMLTD